MFSGAISMRINSEDQIVVVRDKAHKFVEMIGFDKYRSRIISAVISSMGRLLLGLAKTGRIDILTIGNTMKTGVTIIACIEGMERSELEKKVFDLKGVLKQNDFGLLAAKHVIDEFTILPAQNREAVMQITKWA